MGCSNSKSTNKNNGLVKTANEHDEASKQNFNKNSNLEFGKVHKDFENILIKLSDACSWPNKYALVENYNLTNEVKTLLKEVKTVLSRLGELCEYSKAENVVGAILRLRSEWSEVIFRELRLRTFEREEINMGKYCVVAQQYFLVTSLDEDYTTIMVYSFTARELHSQRYACQYHLLYHDLTEEYSLVLVTNKGRRNLWQYGDQCPTYWKVKESILKHLANRQDLENLAASLQLT